jgi:hypothetical protein
MRTSAEATVVRRADASAPTNAAGHFMNDSFPRSAPDHPSALWKSIHGRQETGIVESMGYREPQEHPERLRGLPIAFILIQT